MAQANDEHRCEWCGDNFSCDSRHIGALGLDTCECLQAVVKEVNDEDDGVVDGPTKLAYYCSGECWDAEFPPETSSDEEVGYEVYDGYPYNA